MPDFALWAMACETTFWPAGTFAPAYDANRRAAIESVIDTDPVAACVREIMADRRSWMGSASDLLRACADRVAMTSREEVQAGQEIRAHSPADCVACKHSFGRLALRSPSAVKDGRELGQSTSVRHLTPHCATPSAPSTAVGTRPGQFSPEILKRTSHFLSIAQTMQTMLTQASPRTRTVSVD
jgi:hypothetical protein